MKLKTRVLGAVSTLVLAGSMGAVAMAPAAHADVTLEACQATLLSSITPPLGATDVLTGTVIKGADKTTETCTGALASTTGNAISQSSKLTGVGSCPGLAAPPGSDPAAYPFNGSVAIKYANINPTTTKNFASTAYTRLGSSPLGADALHISGIVTKGVAVGADVSGDLGFDAWWDKKFTQAWSATATYAKGDSVAYNDIPYKAKVANGPSATTPDTDPTTWAAGTGPAGPESTAELVSCVSGTGSIPYAKAFTTGTTTALFTPVASAITLSFPT